MVMVKMIKKKKAFEKKRGQNTVWVEFTSCILTMRASSPGRVLGEKPSGTQP